MMAFISYTMQIVMAFMILTMVSVMLPRAEVAAERVDDVLGTKTSIAEPANPQLPAADAPRGELIFDDVSFAYPDASADVIEHVSFTVAPGRPLASSARRARASRRSSSSSHASTTSRAVAVTLDGVDVRNMALSELRRRIGYVPQQGMLFSGTVESNLKFAGDSVTDADMERAAGIAQASDFIAEREGGYASDISQGGSNVSGGSDSASPSRAPSPRGPRSSCSTTRSPRSTTRPTLSCASSWRSTRRTARWSS